MSFYNSVKHKIHTLENESFKWQQIYRLPFIHTVSAFNRINIYQGLLGGCIVPLSYMMEQSDVVPSNTYLTAGMIGLSGLFTLSLISFPFQNIIGIIYINDTAD